MVKKGLFFKSYDRNFNFKNRQNLDDVFIRSGSMYFFEIMNIKKYGLIFGKKIFGYEVKNKYLINIDRKEELKCRISNVELDWWFDGWFGERSGIPLYTGSPHYSRNLQKTESVKTRFFDVYSCLSLT